MNAKTFKSKIEKEVSKIEDIISKMPYKGDSESESQKIYLTNKLNQFSYAVNGVTDDDFITNEEE